MASNTFNDQLKGRKLALEDVIPEDKELGHGAFGKVFTVNYLGTRYAAKEILPHLLDKSSPEEKKKIQDNFMRECHRSSLACHPNIVQFIGVYYKEESDLPIMVMELLDMELTSFIEKNQSKIAVKTKLSILHDVSLGLSYLHGSRPAIIHRDLSSNNVLLTSHLVAKISDLGMARIISADGKIKWTTGPGTRPFMPPEAMVNNPVYGIPVDVFSFAGITLHLFSEEWPALGPEKIRDPDTNMLLALSEVQRRQQYLDTMTVEAAVLKEMVLQCLDDDPNRRPPIQEVSKMIKSLKETPPLAEALQSGRYHIKWTTCSDLPSPMCNAYIAMSNGIIYCTGTCPDENNDHRVYCYDTRSNQWKRVKRPGHLWGVIHMVDDKLTIFGGRDSITKKMHNKVTTYNSETRSWKSHFPNMLHNRLRPGVVTSHDHIIVMGGKSGPNTYLDSIEVMNYRNDLQWRELSVHLPLPMWGIRPTVSGDDIIVVGYGQAGGQNNRCYQILTEKLILSPRQPPSHGAILIQWKELSAATHYNTTTIPYSNPPVIIGGSKDGATTSDVSLYDIHNNSWRKIDSITSARDCVGVALINFNTIIVIGGTSDGKGVEGAEAHSLTKVEIGTIVPNQ